VLVKVARGRILVYERVIDEPLDRAAVSTGIAEGIPRRQQFRVLLMQFGSEPAKGALALDNPR
jgi:hypothetical protein